MKLINQNKVSSSFFFHPILLGLYPVLALYSFNITEITFSGIWQALITACAITIVFVLFFLLFFRPWEKATVYASLALLMFFFYGHVFDLVGKFNEPLARHRYFIPAWILLFAGIVSLLHRYPDAQKLTRFLNATSQILLVSVSVNIVTHAIQTTFAGLDLPEDVVIKQPLNSSTDRDVYYILVDALSRQDLLANTYGLDVTSFTSQLTQMGFYIPKCNQSNYDYTVASLESSLNMQYLDTLGLVYGGDEESFMPILQRNQVRLQFENLGYSTVTFRSLYPVLDIKDSTYYFDYFENKSELDNLASLNFQYLFLRTTAVRPLIELMEARAELKLPPLLESWIPVNNILSSRDYKQYQQNVFALNSLETIPGLPGKKFVYAHLYVTHQPFVFYPDGRFHANLRQNNSAYRDQVVFATGRLLQIVKTIIENSKTLPIIIIQGDHSYSKNEDRVKNFSAYYFPDGGSENLYDTVTPVNTFRLLFNTYFEGDYELLPDISFYGDAKGNVHEALPSCVNGVSQ